jgi:hypothetical protein
MRIQKKMVFLVLTLAAIATMLLALPNQTNRSLAFAGQEDNNMLQEPVAEYAAANRADSARQLKSARYNKKGSKPIEELPLADAVRLTTAHFWVGLPALPVEQSNAVVLGEVVDAQAYLSGDRTNVYSEFTIRVEEVLKNDDRVALAPNCLVATDRPGGAVRFPSGRIQRFRTHRQGLPQKGKHYVLFLKRTDQGESLTILTGYELRPGRVIPLDGEDVKDKKAELQFAKYRGLDERSFLNEVRTAVTQASQTSHGMGGHGQ